MPLSYTIDFTDPTKSTLTLLPGHAYPNIVSLVLHGMGSTLYGESINENFVHLLENFANSTAPIFPTEGQLWYDNVIGEIRVYTITAGSPIIGTWMKIGSIAIQSTPITNPNDGDLWFDTSVTAVDASATSGRPLKIYQSGAWVTIVDDYLTRDGRKPMEADLDMNTHKVVNVVDPTTNQDAMTLGYANTNFINTSGDTMNGVLTLGAGLTIPYGQRIVLGTSHDDQGAIYKHEPAVDESHTRIKLSDNIGTVDFLDIGSELTGIWTSATTIDTAGNIITTGSVNVAGAITAADIQGQNISSSANINCGGWNFILGTQDQVTHGNSGSSRALVKSSVIGSSSLVLNFGGDFPAGTVVSGSGGLSVDYGLSVGALKVGSSSVNFWDDTNDEYRSIRWDDTAHEFQAENSAGGNYRIWHKGNHGVGSGLDADTVDGLHASSFLTSSSLSGGNYAGNTQYTAWAGILNNPAIAQQGGISMGANEKWLITAHGYTFNRGNGGAWIQAGRLYNGGTNVYNHRATVINWMDGHSPMFDTFYVDTAVWGAGNYTILFDNYCWGFNYTGIRIK